MFIEMPIIYQHKEKTVEAKILVREEDIKEVATHPDNEKHSLVLTPTGFKEVSIEYKLIKETLHQCSTVK